MEIFDNFISDECANFIEKYFCGGGYGYRQMWSFSPKTSGLDNPRLERDLNVVDNGHNVHAVCDNDHIINPQSYSIILPIIESIDNVLKNKGLIPTSLQRIKINMTFPNSQMTSETYGCPHLDSEHYSNDEFRDYTFIYYINDSDGDTFLFDLKYTEKYSEEDCDYKILKRITPKKNRCLFFESNMLHSGNSPINSDYRQVINIIVTCKSK